LNETSWDINYNSHITTYVILLRALIMREYTICLPSVSLALMWFIGYTWSCFILSTISKIFQIGWSAFYLVEEYYFYRQIKFGVENIRFSSNLNKISHDIVPLFFPYPFLQSIYSIISVRLLYGWMHKSSPVFVKDQKSNTRCLKTDGY